MIPYCTECFQFISRFHMDRSSIHVFHRSLTSSPPRIDYGEPGIASIESARTLLGGICVPSKSWVPEEDSASSAGLVRLSIHTYVYIYSWDILSYSVHIDHICTMRGGIYLNVRTQIVIHSGDLILSLMDLAAL